MCWFPECVQEIQTPFTKENAVLNRIIHELELFLMSPMKSPEDWWEQEERIFLCDLLAQLIAQRDRAGAAP
jgi:hypothetical protein